MAKEFLGCMGILGMTLGLGGAACADMAITAGGQARAAIVVPDSPHQMEKFAAEELAKYVERMSGVRLPVVVESRVGAGRGNLICLGNTGAAELLGIRPAEEEVGYDGYALQTVGESLIMRGGRPKGTLFGVYRLLEEMGCRFYGPWEDSEIIPEVRDIKVKAYERREKPAVKYRFTYAAPHKWSFLFRARFQQWLLKIGLSDAGGVGHAATYGFHYFMPEDKYYESHPEWYALHFGRRVRDSGDLCVSNAGMRAEFASNVVAWFREHADQEVAPINAHDGPARCECEECRELDDPDFPEDRMRRMLVFANDIAERVTMVMPEKRLGLYAYYAGAYRFPDDIEPHPAIMPIFFPTHDFAAQREVIEKWAGKVEGIYLYYWIGSSFEELDWLDAAFYENFGDAVRQGAVGWYPELTGWSPGAALLLYFMAQKAWDEGYDVEKAKEDYLKNAFGPAAERMKDYYVAHQQARRNPSGEGLYGPYSPEIVVMLNQLLDEAESKVKGLEGGYATRILRARLALKVATDFANCRALTAKYAETRNEEDRLEGAKAVELAIAFLKAIRGWDVIWTEELLDGVYRHYHYMRSIVSDLPRTRFKSRGPFEYYYDSMYEGPLTLADAVEVRGGVTARSDATEIEGGSEGEVVYEFLAPPNAVFDSAEIIPNYHYRPIGLANFRVEVSADAGRTWKLLTTDPAEASALVDISAVVKGKASFLVRYGGRNDSSQRQVFVDNPKISGRIVDSPGAVTQVRYWAGWEREMPPLPALEAGAVVERVSAPKLPGEVVLFRSEADLGYWGSYHQGLEYHEGEGANDDSCLRLWETEGPGATFISGIPTEPGAKYGLEFSIRVSKGKAQVSTEAAWEYHLSLSTPKAFEPRERFEKAEIEIQVSEGEIDPEKRHFSIYFVHEGEGAEFFVDDVVLHKEE